MYSDCHLNFDAIIHSLVTVTEHNSISSTFFYCEVPTFFMFGHVAGMDGKADLNQMLFELALELWGRSRTQLCSTCLKNIANDLSFVIRLLEAREQPRIDLIGGYWPHLALCTQNGAC